jgi:hypothetical protein
VLLTFCFRPQRWCIARNICGGGFNHQGDFLEPSLTLKSCQNFGPVSPLFLSSCRERMVCHVLSCRLFLNCVIISRNKLMQKNPEMLFLVLSNRWIERLRPKLRLKGESRESALILKQVTES